MLLPSGSQRGGQVGIRHGNPLWREFLHATHADCPSISAAALFDHRVVGTMSHEEAVTVGTELDHSHVSRGGRWSRIFAQKTRRYRPMSNRTGP